MDAGEELLVVANRLPVRRVGRGDRARWETSPGGLVSALAPTLRRSRGTWIGWAGTTDGSAPEPFEHDGIRNLPLALSRAEHQGYYEGLSNTTLWPLYHDCVRPPRYHRPWWRTYEEVNRRFAEAAARVAGEGACVWVQDYHLQLVPRLLRALRPDLRIGFFLHIPFPPQELFAQLPWRARVLEGLLGADLVGFQTPVGATNFACLAERYTAAEATGEGALAFEGREVRHGAFPISVDYERLATLAASPDIERRQRLIARRLGGRRVLLGVDRLDYTKGIDVRLEPYGEALASGALDVREHVLVQTAVPSRERVAAYREERQRVERQIGEINGRYAELGLVAVHYLHKNLPLEEVVALYRCADVMLVTPLRDGMNLVAKEYAASRTDERGVLLLSEFAGAALELDGALLVNPHDLDGLAERMVQALHLSESEQRRRMRGLRRTVREHDVYRWASSFLDALAACPAPA